MALIHRQPLHSLARMPFIDSPELALILGEPHSTVHRVLTDLSADGIVGRVSHGTDGEVAIYIGDLPDDVVAVQNARRLTGRRIHSICCA